MTLHATQQKDHVNKATAWHRCSDADEAHQIMVASADAVKQYLDSAMCFDYVIIRQHP